MRNLILLLVSAVLFFVAPALADSVGPQYAGAGSNVTGLGTVAWTNTGNIVSDNNSNASAAFGSGSGASSNWLVSSSHDFSAMPSGSTINGIVLELGISASTGSRCSDTDVYLTKDGSTNVGSNKATSTNVTTSEVVRTYGGASDLWGTTWADTDIKSSTFGGMLRLLQGVGSTTANVDYMRITVYYTPPASSGSSQQLQMMGISKLVHPDFRREKRVKKAA